MSGGIISRVFLAAILGGAVAGCVLALGHQFLVVPMILEAESYETASGDGHDHAHPDEAWAPQDGVERTTYTVLTSVLTAMGFALLLTACYALRRQVTWRQGLLWGLGGFAAFHVAPAVGGPAAGTARRPGGGSRLASALVADDGRVDGGRACDRRLRAGILRTARLGGAGPAAYLRCAAAGAAWGVGSRGARTGVHRRILVGERRVLDRSRGGDRLSLRPLRCRCRAAGGQRRGLTPRIAAGDETRHPGAGRAAKAGPALRSGRVRRAAASSAVVSTLRTPREKTSWQSR